MSKLFVYGTLKRSGRAHSLLARWEPVFLGEAITHQRYQLYDQGAFPGMVINEEQPGGVHGELFDVSDNCLVAMDHYEGVEHNLFRRVNVELADGTEAIAYLIVTPSSRARWIENGVWYGQTAQKTRKL